MSESDKFHEYMKAEHERKKERKKIREYRDSTYIAILTCSFIPAAIIFILIEWFFVAAILPFLFIGVYVNTAGIIIIAYTYHFYKKLNKENEI